MAYDVDRVMRDAIASQMAAANKRAAAELARAERHEHQRQRVETLPPVLRSIGRVWLDVTTAPILPALIIFAAGVITGALITALILGR